MLWANKWTNNCCPMWNLRLCSSLLFYFIARRSWVHFNWVTFLCWVCMDPYVLSNIHKGHDTGMRFPSLWRTDNMSRASSLLLTGITWISLWPLIDFQMVTNYDKFLSNFLKIPSNQSQTTTTDIKVFSICFNNCYTSLNTINVSDQPRWTDKLNALL